METKNLGLVKALFKQSTAPTRTDVLWYDTNMNCLKYYDDTLLAWTVLKNSTDRSQLLGAVTEPSSTSAEITGIIGITAVAAGAGYRVTIKNSGGSGKLFYIESDGTDWWFWGEVVKAV